MSDFIHSIVLFTGDDGLPLEFNVRNTVDKTHLKALIEYGGGFCTQNENAVHLISPGTKVLNVDTGTKLVSSSYIYDCVKENYLLDVNDYVFTIAEAQTSDISDENSEESLIQRHSTCKSPKKVDVEKMNFQISPIKSAKIISFETDSTTPSNLTLNSNNSAAAPTTNSPSTHSESFVEGTQDQNSIVKITSHLYSENKPVEKSSSPIKLFSPKKNNSSVFSPQKCIVVEKEAFLFSPTDCLPFSGNPKSTPPHKAYCDSLVFSPKKIADQFPNKSHAFAKSPIKNFKVVSPRKCQINKEAILSSPLRCLPFSDNNTKEASTIEAMELCNSLLISPNKSATLLPNVTHAFTKSPVKAVEVDQSFMKSPSKREIFALRPVTELFRNSPSPVGFDNQQPGNVTPTKTFGVCRTDSPSHTVVTSSQQEEGLDRFDNMLLRKLQMKPLAEDEDSQSFTVSSSADASKPCSSDVNAPELPKENEPDSPSLISSQINVTLYMRNLEEKMEKILKQTPPLSMQDKIDMVKYICCVRKLPPASVLNSVFTHSLDL